MAARCEIIAGKSINDALFEIIIPWERIQIGKYYNINVKKDSAVFMNLKVLHWYGYLTCQSGFRI